MTMILSGDGTVTGLVAGGLPNATIVQADLASGVAGNGPAFSAYLASNQSVTSSTFTKLAFATEEFDTNLNYDTINYRFTPTVAGYYQVCASVAAATNVTQLTCAIYKNGSLHRGGYQLSTTATSIDSTINGLVYLNGSTDYIEAYTYAVGTTPSVVSTNPYTFFQAFLARTA